MSDRRRTIFRQRKIRAPYAREVLIFLVFIIISTFFWFLYALSKPRVSDYQFNLVYKNIPNQYVVANDLQKQITVKVGDVGISLLLYQLLQRDKSIEIDLSRRFNSKEIPFEISSKELQDKIKQKINKNTEVISFTPNIIGVEFSKLFHKKLPVRMLGNVTLYQQYTYMGDIIISPSYIDVYGAKQILDTVSYIDTKPIFLKDLTETAEKVLDVNKLRGLKYSVDRVKVKIPVEQFTEKALSVIINAKNLPKTVSIKTFPASVNVTFLVGLSQYDKITEGDFEAYVDYDSFNSNTQKQAAVKVVTTNDKISNIRVQPQSVEYILEELITK